MQLAANVSTMFNEWPLAARFEQAARVGFKAVEAQFLYDLPPAEARRALDDSGLALVLINAPAGDLAQGELGFASLAGEQGRFSQSIEAAIDYALETGCPRIHVMLGKSDPAAHADVRLLLVENLRTAADTFARAGLDLLIEALNPHDQPGYALTTIEAAETLRRQVGRPNVRLQFDVYHAQRSGGDLTRRLIQHMPAIGHIQISSAPSRNEPDRGEIAYERLLPAIDAMGYEGFIGCEYRPVADTLEGLGWAAAYGIKPT